MFAAMDSESPETWLSSGTLAVLRSTPTAFTASSTTASRDLVSFDSVRSCWYWPTPMCLGSIFTSSASGSWRRRAIETAPRSDTSRPGSSLVAYADAEYTDAPASETTIFVRFALPAKSLARSAASRSVSREAVPLPMATSSTPCFWTSAASAASEASHRFCGWCG